MDNANVSLGIRRNWIMVYIVILLVTSIVDFVIGAQHVGATCNNDAIVSLSTWLFVTGTITLAFLVVPVLVFIVYYVVTSIKPDYLSISEVPAMILLIVFFLFYLAWNIVGAVALFRDSTGCLRGAISLWGVTLVNLILQWLSTAYVILCGCSS